MFTGVSRMASILISRNCLARPFGSESAYASRWRSARACIRLRVFAERITTKSQGCE